MMIADNLPTQPLRPVITWTLVVCVAVAMAPWMSGGQEPLALLLSTGAVLLASLLAWRQPSVRRLYGGPLVAAYGLLLGWGGLSLAWTVNRYSSVLWLVLVALAGLVFCLAYIVAGENHGRDRLVGGYVASAAVFSGYGIWLYLTDTYDRFTSTFYWANPAAAYLIPAILLCLYGLRSSGRARWGWTSGLVLFLTAFLLADSRASTLVLLLVVGLYLLTQSHKRRFWITLVFSIIMAYSLSNISLQVRHLLSPTVAITAPGSRFAEVTTGESRSGSDRVEYLRSAGEMWWQHPLGGVGAGAYGDAHPQYQGRVVSAATSAHNMYAQTLAELGLVGVILLAWVLLVLILGSLRGLIQTGGRSVALALGLVGLLLHAGLDIDARYPAIVLLIATLAGVLYTQVRWSRQPGSWRLWTAAAFVLVPVLGLYQSSVWVQRARVNQDDGAYETAAEQFSQAYQTGVYNPDVLSAQGINLYALALESPEQQRGRLLARALQQARAAQRQDPADGQHYQLSGRVLQARGELDAAERSYREALRWDPYNHPEYALDLASLQYARGRLSEAKATADSMLAQYSDEVIANRNNDETVRPAVADLWALVGNIELRRGNMVAVRAAVGRALTVEPQNVRGRGLKHQLMLPAVVH